MFIKKILPYIVLAILMLAVFAQLRENLSMPIVYKSSITGNCVKALGPEGEKMSCAEAEKGRHDIILM